MLFGDDEAELLRAGCLRYTEDDLAETWRDAEALLARHPQVARASIHTACLTGAIDHVRDLLARDPALATAPGGPQGWPPLLFVCYGRVPNAHAVAIAELLLDHGADANTCFLWDGKLRFAALTGAIGRGEMGQPSHPAARALAELLLARGADPNDSQAMYNDMLEGDDDAWLRLLLAHGLTAADRINWQPGVEIRLLDFLLGHAVRHDHRRRVACLLEHGADPGARDFYNGKTARENADAAGHREVAAMLAAAATSS